MISSHHEDGSFFVPLYAYEIRRKQNMNCKTKKQTLEKEFLKDFVIIKHIPHASLEVPEDFKSEYPYNTAQFQEYNLKMSDVGVDRLFIDLPGIEIKAKYTRLFCDVERFKGPKIEPMEKLGMGYNYCKYYDGVEIHKPSMIHGMDTRKIVEEYYDDYHFKLNQIVRKLFDEGKSILLLDIHSYSDDLANALGKKGPYPDICLGVEEGYYSKELLDAIILEIKKRNLSYQINFPYAGSLLPSDVIQGKIKGKIYSIMIEINKRIYL